MIHPATELRFINDEIGYGVVAKTLIPKGTITWVQDELDRIFTPQQASELSPAMGQYLEKYSFTNSQGNQVLCWDNAKFVNHSFNPSCMSTAYDFEIAIRDIPPGEQLTDDYGYLNVSEPFAVVDEGTDRKIVYPDDLLRYHQSWDGLIKSCFDAIASVNQPMLEFVPENLWRDFKAALDGKAELRSLLTCYFDREKLSV